MASLGAAASTSSSNLKSNKMGFSARLFHGFRKSENTSSTIGRSPNTEPKNHSNGHWNGNGHSTGSDEVEATLSAGLSKALKVTSERKSSTAAKKLKMLGRYFQVREAPILSFINMWLEQNLLPTWEVFDFDHVNQFTMPQRSRNPNRKIM